MAACAICGKTLGWFDKYQCYDESDMLLTICTDCKKNTFPERQIEAPENHLFVFNAFPFGRPPRKE
ncbi:MAG: hypothetical protein JW771_06175 [Candidatus Thermoplasmatota archaeon]|nr:hypothetical protein [Candidatus Thermoplasmatota archaeon]